MKTLRERLEEVGKRFGITLTPENVDEVLENTWKKYYEKSNRRTTDQI